MTILEDNTDNSGNTTPLTNAALDYAKNGIPIVFFDAAIRNGKECGNLVGNADDHDKWCDHTSTDPAVIREWLARFGARATGIATSPGAADAVVLDVDKPELVPLQWQLWMGTAPFQSTDENDPRRGHSWFALPPGERFGNPSVDWGEIRCDGGGLILCPTPHARVADGGRYEWIRQGETPPLPEVIATALRAKNNGHGTTSDTRAVGGSPTLAPVAAADVAAFCEAHRANDRPKALD